MFKIALKKFLYGKTKTKTILIMKIIYIHIEITAREYYSKFLLSYFAAKEGYTVILGDIMRFLNIIPAIRVFSFQGHCTLIFKSSIV